MDDTITWEEIYHDLSDDFITDYTEQEYSVVMNGLINAYFEDTI